MSPEQEEFIKLMRADSRRSSMDICSKLLDINPAWMPLVWKELQTADYPFNFRASRVLDLAHELYPPLGEDLLKDILEGIQEPREAGIVRQLLRMLTRISLTEEQLFGILDFCIDLIRDPETAVAIKVYSMKLVLKFCRFQPAFKQEFELLLFDQYEHQKPAFKARARMTLKKLNQIIDHNGKARA